MTMPDNQQVLLDKALWEMEERMWKPDESKPMEPVGRNTVWVGYGITVDFGGNRSAYTVEHVSASGRKLTLSKDSARLSKTFVPKFDEEGLCVNQDEQTYVYRHADRYANTEDAFWSEKHKRYTLRGNPALTGRVNENDCEFS